MHERPAPAPVIDGRSPQYFAAMLYTLTPRIVVTWLVLGVNVAAYAAMVARGVDWLSPGARELLAWGANYGPATVSGEWWRLVTGMFLHFGLLHLAANMWGLYVLGPPVERFVGHVGFALLYLISGIAGSLASLYWHPEAVSAGASGAVFGVLGALLGFVLPQWRSVPRPLFTSVLSNGAFVILLNVVIGMQVPQIDNAAHLGGLGAGALCGLALSQPLTPRTPRRRVWRNVLLAIVGAAVLSGAALWMPAVRFQRAFDRFNQVEDRVFKEYRRLRERQAEQDISAADFAEAVETRILPPWREALEGLEAPGNLPPAWEATRAQLVRAMRLRAEAWELEARGLRENDRRLLRQAIRKAAEYNALLERHRLDE